MSAPMFIFGGNTGVSSPKELKRLRDIAEALGGRTKAPQNVGEGLNAIAEALLYRSTESKAEKMEQAGLDSANASMNPIIQALGGSASAPASTGPSPDKVGAALIGQPDAANELASGNPAPDVSDNGSTFQPFIDTVKAGGLTNPYGLAAVAATGKAESGWSSKNATSTWDDPSESGQPGRAGGIMSWRGPRYQALAATGDLSPEGQAKFFLQEDPELIAKLNNAKSVEEAQGLMNRAWAFRGYDRPGGEAARRLGLANAYAPKFQGDNTQVASLDPSAGISPAAAAIETQAPRSGYVDPRVSAQPGPTPQPMPTQQSAPAPGQFDMRRFGDPIKLAEMPASQAELPANLANQASAYAPQPQPPQQMVSAQPQQAAAALPALPSRDVGPAPRLAGMPQQKAPTQVAQAQQTGPNIGQLYQALQNPWLTPQQQSLIVTQINRLQQDQDPDTIMKRQYMQAQTDAMLHPQPKYSLTTLPDGTVLRSDDRGGMPQKVFESTQKPTANMQDYDAYAADEKAAGRTPVGRMQYEQELKKAGSSSTTVNVGEGGDFYKELDKKNADTFSTLSSAGMEARGKLARIDRLEGLMSNAPQGAIGALKQAAGEWGIPTEGVSDIQAASALLEKMVPEQRLPGSGTMSDGDIKMFRNSLPKILNQPGGNELIFQTLRGVAQYEQQMGEIADAVADREIDPAEARRRIRELKNPLADFKISDKPTPNEGNKTKTGVTWSVE